MLANNHVLDWGPEGLVETLEVLEGRGLVAAGAGRDRGAAEAPRVMPVGGGRRVVVLALGHPSSGIPPEWAATAEGPGVFVLRELTVEAAAAVGERLASVRREGDLVVVSIHWGGNWGHAVPRAFRRFAHALVDEAGVDLVHGHSCHHPQGIEVYRDRLVLYGCGDFLNDYEGIRGHEEYRPDLTVMYFPGFDGDGRLVELAMTPMRIRRMRLERASPEDRRWLGGVLDRESARFGTRVRERDGGLAVEW